MTMLTDGIKNKSLEDQVKQLDVAELLERACAASVPSEVAPERVENREDPSPPQAILSE
jgi:hypothetical protein